MIDKETQQYIDEKIRSHIHDGNYALRVNFPDLFLYTFPLEVHSATIATTGVTSMYFIAPYDMSIVSLYFAGGQGLVTSDTNYITWTMTNLGLDANGAAISIAMLATTPAGINTTKTTGGTAILSEQSRQLTLSGTANNLQVYRGQVILITATVTGTLANTVVFPVYMIVFQ